MVNGWNRVSDCGVCTWAQIGRQLVSRAGLPDGEATHSRHPQRALVFAVLASRGRLDMACRGIHRAGYVPGSQSYGRDFAVSRNRRAVRGPEKRRSSSSGSSRRRGDRDPGRVLLRMQQSLPKSDTVRQCQHSEAFLEDRSEPLGASLGLAFMKRATSVGLTWFSANLIASTDSTRTPKYRWPPECVSKMMLSPITPQECCRHT
jgi:hypothetical protein